MHEYAQNVVGGRFRELIGEPRLKSRHRGRRLPAVGGRQDGREQGCAHGHAEKKSAPTCSYPGGCISSHGHRSSISHAATAALFRRLRALGEGPTPVLAVLRRTSAF